MPKSPRRTRRQDGGGNARRDSRRRAPRRLHRALRAARRVDRAAAGALGLGHGGLRTRALPLHERPRRRVLLRRIRVAQGRDRRSTSPPASRRIARCSAKLGKHRVGKGCLYLRQLADADREILRQLVARGIARLERVTCSVLHRGLDGAPAHPSTQAVLDGIERRLGAVLDAELVEDDAHVALDRALREVERSSRSACCCGRARSARAPSARAASARRTDPATGGLPTCCISRRWASGWSHGLAGVGRAHGAREVVLEHVLEQVADRAGADGLAHLVVLGEARQHEHLGRRGGARGWRGWCRARAGPASRGRAARRRAPARARGRGPARRRPPRPRPRCRSRPRAPRARPRARSRGRRPAAHGSFASFVRILPPRAGPARQARVDGGAALRPRAHVE